MMRRKEKGDNKPMQIYKPTEEDLHPLLDEATTEAGQTIEEWMPKLLASLKSILLASPLQYRSYGPYWWLLKKAYIDVGDLAFGIFIDLFWLQAMDYGRPELTLLAAWAYSDARFNRGLATDPSHILEEISGDEPEAVEYVSADLDMETLAARRR